MCFAFYSSCDYLLKPFFSQNQSQTSSCREQEFILYHNCLITYEAVKVWHWKKWFFSSIFSRDKTAGIDLLDRSRLMKTAVTMVDFLDEKYWIFQGWLDLFVILVMFCGWKGLFLNDSTNKIKIKLTLI